MAKRVRKAHKGTRPSTETIIPTPGFTVRGSAGRGRGLYTEDARRKGEELFVVEGRTHEASYDTAFDVGPTWFGAGPGRWVEPSESNLGRFINHACEPNACVVDFVHVVAARAIAAGEEITIDYALTEEDPFWSMECRCGAPSCCKTVRSAARFGKEPAAAPPQQARAAQPRAR
jgi:hypothetical protein